MPAPAIDSSALGRAWIMDVLCGAMMGCFVVGWPGMIAGALFMAVAGHVHRIQRLRREAQIHSLRQRAALRRWAGARVAAPSDDASAHERPAGP